MLLNIKNGLISQPDSPRLQNLDDYLMHHPINAAYALDRGALKADSL